MNTFLKKLLDFYSLTEEEYNKMLVDESIPFYDVFPKIKEVVSYFKKAIIDKKKIIIYGDYDCDGVMSTAIMMNLFKREGYTAGFYIPSREDDGYGLNKANIDKFHELGYDIILCVDNGITLCDEIDYANSLGMECVIFDHHTIMENIPNAKYILHPSLSDIGEYNISAGEVCFYFSYAYLDKIDDYLLTLGAISCVSDMMVLKSYNRNILRLGLKKINEHKYQNIIDLIGNYDFGIINEENFAMTIAPKINSIGRILNDNSRFNIVKYFIDPNDVKNGLRLNWINHVNDERKAIVNETSANLNYDKDKDSIIVLTDENEGVCGLIANKLLTTYNKPTVVFANGKEEGVIKGSARSKNGLSIVKAFESCKDLLLTYGGHECAGGLSLNIDNIDEFKSRFNEYSKEHPFIEKEDKYIDIELSEINLENYNIFRNFAPFGEGNQKPLFRLKNYCTQNLNYSRNRLHIITSLSLSSKLVYFNYDINMKNKPFVDFVGTFNRQYFNGNYYIQFTVKKWLEPNN